MYLVVMGTELQNPSIYLENAFIENQMNFISIINKKNDKKIKFPRNSNKILFF